MIPKSVIQNLRNTDPYDVVSQYVDLKKHGKEWLGLCPFHSESTPSFTVVPAKGFYHCFGCGAHGDVIDFVRKINDLSFQEAVSKLTGDNHHPVKVQPKIKPEPKPIAFEDSPASKVWKRSHSIYGSLGEKYLKMRGCFIPPEDGALRFVPSLRYPRSNDSYPALVALVTDAITNEKRTLRTTFLNKHGTGKAPVPNPKLTWKGLSTNGVIKLCGDEDVFDKLCIAEGIETALTAAYERPQVWATGDSGTMKKFPDVERIKDLVIVADNDIAGARASEEVASRYYDAGCTVKIYKPSEEKADLNDMVTA